MLGSSEFAESGVRVSSRILRRYVLRGEQVEVATRQHWAKLSEPVFTVIVGFFLVFYVSMGLERAFGEFGLYLWWVWFGLIGRLIWRVFEWRNEWFVATDKRLLLTYGLFTHKVAMMPLGKVTDLNYGRSITGRMLGYGDFTLESAGQDQALRQINWLPSPDQTYRRICDIIFGPERYDSEDSLAQHDDPSSPDSDQTDFNHRAPQHPEPPRQRYTSKKIAAKADGGMEDELDDYEDHESGDNPRDEVDVDDAADEADAAADVDETSFDDSADGEDVEDEQGHHDDETDDPWRVDGAAEDRADGESSVAGNTDAEPLAAEEQPGATGEGDDGLESDDNDDEWVVDEKSREWGPRSRGSDDSWQSSREGAPAYQRVQPRKRTIPDDEDITGPIP